MWTPAPLCAPPHPCAFCLVSPPCSVTWRGTVLHSCAFFTCPQLPCPENSPMDYFLGMSDTYLIFVMGLPPSTKIYMKFIHMSVLSGCSHGAEVKETPSEQNVFVEMPRINTSKTNLSTQKGCPWEIGSLELEGGVHLAEELGTNPN